MAEKLNPARLLENLLEDALAQRIFAVDLAYGFTRLERHAAQVRAWWEGLAARPELHARVMDALAEFDRALGHVRTFAEEKSLGDLDRGLALARSANWMLEDAAAR
ncbi:MAG: hypothetical protein AB1758_23545, partial [Candidatus Eremiobacterota bacterium]